MSNILAAPKDAGISRIPPEILSEIFLHCLPADFASKSQSQNTQQLLSDVCRLWRAVVLATPSLWASLDITCSINTLHPPLPVIRTHLQRSGAHPLSFFIHMTGPTDSHESPHHLLSVLTTLTAARQRWENVKIKLYRMTQDTLNLITQGDAPLLRSIQCYISGSLPKGFPVPFRMLDHCPRLESFEWGIPGSSVLLPLVHTGLTSVSLIEMRLSVSECITILRLSPRLSSARFHILNPPGFSTTLRLTHPTLCTLIVQNSHSSMLLDSLTLPALLKLDLTSGVTQSLVPPEWGIVLPAFLERSKPMLRELTLRMIEMELEPTFVRILTLTPHLHTLQLGGGLRFTPVNAALIRALYYQPPPSTSLCPRLQRVALSVASNCPDGLCAAMLRARWGAHARANGVACLKSAYILFRDGVHDRDRVDMQKLSAGGMCVTIRDKRRPRGARASYSG